MLAPGVEEHQGVVGRLDAVPRAAGRLVEHQLAGLIHQAPDLHRVIVGSEPKAAMVAGLQFTSSIGDVLVADRRGPCPVRRVEVFSLELAANGMGQMPIAKHREVGAVTC